MLQIDIVSRRTHEGDAMFMEEFWEFWVFGGVTPTSPHRLATEEDSY